jgi:type I restriction enzyme S subunit
MKVGEKYKQTEVGIIPSDWEVKSLKDLSILITKGTTPKRFTTAGVTYVKIESLAGDEINIEKCLFIDDVTHKTDLKRSVLNEADLLFAIAGATIGKCTIVPNKILPANTNQALAIIRLKEDENKMYVFYFLKSTLMQKYIIDNIAGGAQPNLNLAQVGAYFFPTPPTKAEQTAIATALSDADALISSLSTLIAKKRMIKQGAMQQLLQAKEGWEVKKLPELVWFQEGPGVRNSQFKSSGVKLLNGTNIEDGKLILEKTDRYISEKEAYGWYSHFLVNEGDILIACSGVTIDRFDEKVTIANYSHLPLCMNTSTMRFKIISKDLSKSYFLHFLKSKSFKEQIGEKATGSAQLNFGPSHVKMVDLSFPTLTEQENISSILSDMDAELAALEAKLEKYRKVKLGMMQNLLTGKIRLV